MRVVVSRIQRASRPRPSVIVELGDEEGRTGRGDAAPLPPFSPDDADGCARALERAREVGPIDEARPVEEAVLGALGPLANALAPAPGARFALETALLDLIAQRRGVPIARLFGAGLGEVPVNGLLLAPPLPALADRAEALAREGYQAIKIKLRANDDAGFERELAALYEVRARLPAPFELRLDPNGAWSIDEARRKLAALAPIAPRYVEQPVAAGELHRLGPCAVPWAADESLVAPGMLPRLLSARGCAAFVLKPALLGGFLRAREIATAAQDRGIDVVVTHLFDGPLAMAAACELALSLPRAPLACGLAPHDDLASFAANFGGMEIPQMAGRGVVRSFDGAGLGARSTWVCEGHG